MVFTASDEKCIILKTSGKSRVTKCKPDKIQELYGLTILEADSLIPL